MRRASIWAALVGAVVMMPAFCLAQTAPPPTFNLPCQSEMQAFNALAQSSATNGTPPDPTTLQNTAQAKALNDCMAQNPLPTPSGSAVPSSAPSGAPTLPSGATSAVPAPSTSSGSSVSSSSFPSSSSCPNLSRTLSIGMSGSDVSALQQFLEGTGDYTYSSVTGYFGSVTQAAVQSFQRSRNIVSSGTPATTGYGVVGPKTRTVIAQVCGGSASTGSSSSSSSNAGAAASSNTSTTDGTVGSLQSTVSSLLLQVQSLEQQINAKNGQSSSN